jgi:hypothetical protein
LYKLTLSPTASEANALDTDSINLVEETAQGELPLSVDLTMKKRCCFSTDGSLFVVATARVPVLAVWKWSEQTLLQEIQIPGFGGVEDHDSKIFPIPEIQFIGNTTMLCVLSATGLFIIIDVSTGQMVYKFPMNIKIRIFNMNNDGSAMSLVLKDDMSTIKFFSMEKLLREKNIITNPCKSRCFL